MGRTRNNKDEEPIERKEGILDALLRPLGKRVRRPPTKFSEGIREAMRGFRRAGLSTAVIAEKFSASYSQTLRIVKGCEPPGQLKGPPRKYPEDIRSQMRALRSTGVTIDEIAMQFQVSYSQTSRIVRGSEPPRGSEAKMAEGSTEGWVTPLV